MATFPLYASNDIRQATSLIIPCRQRPRWQTLARNRSANPRQLFVGRYGRARSSSATISLAESGFACLSQSAQADFVAERE
ncbi:MAG TPA: hypothetical protein VKQ36_12260 [Ktedonobacterales bacterium]|nr:hypothetical protein [Ktedonobacterales bacterium]